ncbi:hypothetical protein M758_7G104100 [Ceratodon purpureus]|uniref:Uncharacterized protein n=1 Tax=Ceratodon purpureus TaxID=3225 RepID=A0A8T0H8T3_CERPU|nr:hypothetical protein KC19_7G110600 [Ceratodon purpureus]KAG0610960.1 hypothetical protein M758_7G104100 [Ceratodon purpureus]
MGTSVLSCSGVDIDTITGDDQAPALSNSEAPTENGDWQALSNFENGQNTVGSSPFYSSDPTDTADVDTAIQASDGGAQNKEAPFYTSVPDDSHSTGPNGQSYSSWHAEPLFYNETVAGVKACWFDQDTARVCNSVGPAGALRMDYGDNDSYGNPSARPGERWTKVACVSGWLIRKLPAGVYTLSWRLKYDAESNLRGLDLGRPVEFTLANTDGTQTTVSHRYLSNLRNVSDRQWELSYPTPVRLVEDYLFEYDAGDITVLDEEKPTSLQFSMVVPTQGVLLWKCGVCLEGVVLRPSSITKSTGRLIDLGSALSAYIRPLPTSTDEQSIVRTRSSIGSTPEAPVWGYSAWSDDDSMPVVPVWGYSAWTDNDSMPVAPVLGYSAWPISTDDQQGIVRTTSPIDSTHEAPVSPYHTYSSSPTSTDDKGFVNNEPLIYTSSIDSTPEAPMLMSSSSPAFQSNFENGHSTIGTIPFYSSDLTIAIDSMSLLDQDAAVPSSAATEHEELSYNLISDSAGVENEEAPFCTSGADDSRSKSPVGQSDSRHTEAPFYTDNDTDVKVPSYTATGASDHAVAQNKDHTLATSLGGLFS